jgi:hypothetical protein
MTLDHAIKVRILASQPPHSRRFSLENDVFAAPLFSLA